MLTVHHLGRSQSERIVGLCGEVPYPNICGYLQRIAARPGYQRALAKGDPGMALLSS